jgi:uncharacterized membrane protein
MVKTDRLEAEPEVEPSASEVAETVLPPADVAPRAAAPHWWKGLYSRWGLALAWLVVLATNVLLLSGTRVAFLGPALGAWVIIVFPTYLLCTTRLWKHVSGAERVAFSLGAVLLSLIAGGLMLDVLLPHLGVPRPLAQRPILIAVDVMDAALTGWRIRRGPTGVTWRANLGRLRQREWRVLAISACCVPLVVAGATRLNNDQGDLVALLGLSGVVLSFSVLLWWRAHLRDSVVSASVYLLGLSLLLATSLRGWYITGHDVQREFRVFQLTKDHGVWNIGSFRDAYNACLSITILPTELWQLIRVDDPYIYKVFFQLVFAMCPVLVYLLARRYWSKRVAILSVVYFVGLPTFFTDMPFLNRQEIAFLYLGLAFLAMSRREWSVLHRRLVMIVCAVGIALSHYSTTYIFIGTLVIGLLAEYGNLLWGWLRRRHRGSTDRSVRVWADTARAVTLSVVIATGLMAFVWGGVITHTATGVTTTIREALPAAGGAHSVDSSYSLFSGGGPSNQELLDKYRKKTLHERKTEQVGLYLPLPKVVDYSTHALNTVSLPATATGRALSDVNVPASTVNSVVRGLASRGEQIFILLGLAALAFLGWRRRQVGRDFYFVGLASVVMVGAVTVLPGLSVSYGLLRSLQQALFLVAPVLVIGSFLVFQWLGRIWSRRVATLLALVFLVSTIGVMPQILGGYPAQLNLNNSGVYYNDYYVHPQEVGALQWLGGQPAVLPGGVQAEPFTDLYYFKDPHDIDGRQYVTDIFPTLVRTSSWVVLGYATVHTGIATASISGDLVPYRYPMGALRQNKDLVYDNGGTVIYK